MIPEPFEIRPHSVGRRIVLALQGEVDIATAPRVRAAIEEAADCRDLWVDLSRVTFLDSTGLSVLVAAQTAYLDGRGSFVVICPDGPVRRVLEVSGVDRHLTLFADRSAANAGA